MPHEDAEIRDERLRLVFTCCHPALAPDAQVALTLRTVAGLRTEEVARLFFTEVGAIAQRLVRRSGRFGTQASRSRSRHPSGCPSA